ncbi:uncharacterized protein METZ01_LOCUS149289 [marine metagenome]|uniref:Uncharacterized protein n=1 Tax=marine metagenome TaxID=408172 RepID=A0A382A4K1_9ZZZZ
MTTTSLREVLLSRFMRSASVVGVLVYLKK